jgi:hypothetical protein
MSWAKVRAWRDALRGDLASAPTCGLSPRGRDLILSYALDALRDDALAQAACTPGRPWDTAAVISPRNTLTACIEWCALLLGHGTHVTLKAPRERDSLAPWLAVWARRTALPLTVVTERDAIEGADAIFVMGSDATVQGVLAAAPAHVRVWKFGSRFSLAWWPHAIDASSARAVARDLAAHDTRGCMSPALILTTAPREEVMSVLRPAMDHAESCWPRGSCTPSEHAALRSRVALAKVVGEAAVTETWSIAHVPAQHASPSALPRHAQVVQVASLEEAVTLVRPWLPRLSTVGTQDLSSAHVWRAAGASRVCPLGQMQSPPLDRVHDGATVLQAVLQPQP